MNFDIVILPEKKGYSVYSVQVPNVVTQGETIEEAKKMLKEALTLYFQDMPQEKEKLIYVQEECKAPLISKIML